MAGHVSRLKGELLEGVVARDAEAAGWYWIKLERRQTLGGAARAGVVGLDWVGCVEGRCVVAETKLVDAARVSASVLRPAQREHADLATERGALVVILCGVVTAGELAVVPLPWTLLRVRGVHLDEETLARCTARGAWTRQLQAWACEPSLFRTLNETASQEQIDAW